MPPGRQRHLALKPKAISDLEGIWLYSAQTWSADQADRYIDGLARAFDMLTALPEIGRERAEFNPPVRLYVHGTHLIVYTIDQDSITVLRVLGHRQDWQSILSMID